MAEVVMVDPDSGNATQEAKVDYCKKLTTGLVQACSPVQLGRGTHPKKPKWTASC